MKKTVFLHGALLILIVAAGVSAYAEPVGEFDDHIDIGSVAAPGSASYDADKGEYAVTGSGADIWDAEDAFHFLYKEVSGSFSVKANVFLDPFESTDDWAKAGLMVRDSLDADAIHYDTILRAQDLHADAQWRAETGGSSSSTSGNMLTLEDQLGDLEIVRVGSTLSTYYVDINTGERTLYDQRTINFTDPVYVGLAVTSHQDGNLSTGYFLDYQFVPIAFGLTRIIPTRIFQSGGSIEGIQIPITVQEGEAPDLTVTENPPAGWTVSNIQTTQGEANVEADGSLVWTIPGATGNPTLTYDVQSPADAKRGVWSGSGDDGSFTLTLPTVRATSEDQLVNCRKFGSSVEIVIDGDFSDWPLDDYGDPAQMPDIDPAEQFANSASTNALEAALIQPGDHYVYNPDKVLINRSDSFEVEGEKDFQAETYIAWDDGGLYLLNIAVDSKIGWDHMNNGDAASAWENDGIEIWFDNDDDRLPPNIQDEQGSQFDLQLDFSIIEPIYEEEGLGGDPLEPNGEVPLDLAIYRSALNTDDADEKAILDQIQRAVKLDDKPAGEHEGYVQEIFLPWGVFPSLEPDEPIGLNINWVDWDDGASAGSAGFQLMRWHQANESDVQYFRGIRFSSDNPLGEDVQVSDWALY